MISSLLIHGLGPYAEPTTYALDATGITEIRRPSRAGKSTLIDALCWLITGRLASGGTPDEGSVTDGVARVEVAATTAKGTVIRKTRTATGSTTRQIGDLSYASDSAYEGAPGLARLTGTVPAGRSRVHVARLILAPLAWTALADGEGGGAPLRDALAALTGATDLRPVVADLVGEAGYKLRETDTIDPKRATTAVTDANRAVSHAEGRLSRSQAPVPDPPDAVSEADLAAARATVAAEEAHAAHAEATRLRTVYEAGRKKLGARPAAPDQKGLADARAAAEKAEGARNVAQQRYDAAATAHERAQRAHAHVEALRAAGDTCPTCARPGWEAAAARLAEAVAALPDLATARRAEESALDAAEAATAARTTAREMVRVAETALDGAIHAAQRWDAAARELGAEPPAPGPKPAGTRPGGVEVRAARAVVTAGERGVGAAQQHERAVAARAEAVARDERELAAARTEAAHMAAVLAAVRRAPSELLRRGVDRLGDLGPVTLHPTDTGIEVRVDGRDWRRASRGELLVADVWLRCAIRRVAKMTWFPLPIDNRQDWSGALPDGIAPAIVLVTEAA